MTILANADGWDSPWIGIELNYGFGMNGNRNENGAVLGWKLYYDYQLDSNRTTQFIKIDLIFS